MMTSRMPWLVLLAMSGRVVAQLPTPTLTARQDPSPTPSPLLVFNAVDQPVSCLSTRISWVYGGPDVSLSLTVTNMNVPQDGLSTQTLPKTFTNTFINKSNPHSLQRRVDILLPIAVGLSPSTHSFNWTVQVPQGNYVVTAEIQTSPQVYVVRSSPFFVQQGTDTSCLSADPSSSSSPSNPSDTSTSSPTTSSATTTSSLSTIPPIGGSSDTPINKGAIAGGVVAGGAVLLGAVGLYLFFLCRPKRDRPSRNRSVSSTHPSSKSAFGGGSASGRWGGLSSVDSHMAMHDTALTATPKRSKKPYVTARHQSQASSVGPFAGGVGASQDDIVSHSGSVAQQNGYPGSPFEEKFGSPHEVSLATLPSNGGSSANARSYSSSTFASELGAAAPATTHRRSSLTANTRANPQRPSIDSTVELQQQSPFTPPPTSPLGLSSSPSPGAQTQPPAQRKTPRKPVPSYTDSSAPTPSPVSPAISPFDSPVLPAGSGGHYATRESSLKSTSSNTKYRSKSKERAKLKRRKGEGSSTNASSEELGGAGQPEGTLVHKSSFGPGGVEGKQLHYLIPDMPVGQ